MESKKGSEKTIRWLGDSKKRLKEFPEDAQDVMGHALNVAQKGGKDIHATPLTGDEFKGASTMEIIFPFDSDTFRVIYSIKSKIYIYVLHSFKKKSKSGIKTPKREMDLIKERLKYADALIKEEAHEK